jgi:fucose 4-O-acetylase-like acetyltransferase
MMQNTISLEPDKKKVSQRVEWIDYAKGIGIFLVVFGHALRGIVSDSIIQSSVLERSVDQWIYAFHMPLFFFLSGLFVERSANKPFKNFLIAKLQTIAYPYFVWSILQEVMRIAAGISDRTVGSLWQIIYEPIMQFWFLYVLFFISLSYAIARKVRISPAMFLVVSILLYALYLFDLNLGSWSSIYTIQANAIYFAVGAIIGSRNWLAYLDKAAPWTLIVSAIAGFGLVALTVYFGVVEVPFLIPTIAFFGIAAVMALSKCLDRFKFARFLRQWGLLSLQIYVAHSIITAIARALLQKLNFSDPVFHLIVGTVAGIYGPIAIDFICKKIKFLYLFTLQPLKVKT